MNECACVRACLCVCMYVCETAKRTWKFKERTGSARVIICVKRLEQNSVSGIGAI